MAVLKCKMCGAQMTVEASCDTVTCRYCESVQTIPKLDNEDMLRMYERATELRLRCDFDQAASVFQSIVTQFPDEAEAYWGLCLCRYGIEYVDDPRTYLKVPTCHRTSPLSILADADFIKATEKAGVLQWKYREEAEAIDAIRCKILDICRNEQPYDIFICYKETDDKTGLRTEDSLTAQDIYTELIKNDYRVFFSRITLRGKAGSEYEPYIYSALNSAKIMLVIGSNKDYFNAVWLKNEWSRYLDMMADDTTKAIIPCFERIRADELPAKLSTFQGLDMGNKLFFTDLLANIERLCPKNKPQKTPSEEHTEAAVGAIAKKEFDYKDGAYSGEAVGSRPHGFGIRYYTNGDRYEGQWHMGEMRGKGTIFYADGKKWTGEWAENRPKNGEGSYYERVNDDVTLCYEGRLVNGLQDGECKYYSGKRLVKEGTFSQGKLNGNGTVYCPDGRRCRGEFRNGKPYNADGVFRLKALGQNAEYQGTWKDGETVGDGKIVLENNVAVVKGRFFGTYSGEVVVDYSDGRCYKGVLKNGAVSGNGSLFLSDKTLKYTGSFENGRYNGKGVLYNTDGSYYDGTFTNGEISNAAHCKSDGTVIFKGEYKNGLPHTGSGTIHYKDGSYAIGTLKLGKLSEFCKVYTKTGKLSVEGFYENGVFIKGTIIYENGNRYTGEIKNNKYHGQGTYTYNEPNWKGVWKGEWRNGYRWTGSGLVVISDENGKHTGKFYDGFMREGKANGKGLLVLENRSRYVGEFRDDSIYNGTYYTAMNTVSDTFVNGVSQNKRNEAIGKAILKGFTGIQL